MMKPTRDPMWDLVDPPKILDTREQEAQWWERQRERGQRLRPSLRLDPGNFQGPSPWSRETAPPIHSQRRRTWAAPLGLWLTSTVTVMLKHPPTPTPGELLAASMRDLPALPPTAGGLCAPAKV